MSDNASRESIIKNGSFPAGHGTSPDIMLLSRAIIDLNVSRKSISIYPEGHVQVARSVARANESLTRLIASSPDLILGVTKNHLLLGQHRLEPKNPALNEFSNVLHSHDIAAIYFNDGLTRAETERFLRILSTCPEEIREAGGIAQAMQDAVIRHIGIEEIDYRRFHLTDESAVTPDGAKEERQPETDIWKEFIGNLISGYNAQGHGSAGFHGLNSIDPSQLADFFNDQQLDSTVAVRVFRKTLATHLSEALGAQGKEKLKSLLSNLNAELQQQFLSATPDIVSPGGEGVFGSFSGSGG